MENGIFTRDDFAKAGSLFERAIALYPNYAEAHVELGFAYVMAFDNKWTSDAPAALRRADDLAMKSVRLAPNNPSTTLSCPS